MGKIAVQSKPPDARVLASGQGWKVCDVICAAGPSDPAFEEQHSQLSLAVVMNGTFQYRTSTGCELMTPGSILLGNTGECFSCGHEHGVGDRCVSFHYSDGFTEQAGFDPRRQLFRIPRIPALRAMSPQVARIAGTLTREPDQATFQEVAFEIFDKAMKLQHGSLVRRRSTDTASLGRVTRVLRAMEASPEAPHTLAELAAETRLSPWHFLRCFEEMTGTTPKQFLLRTRLRKAALALKQDSTKILDIGFDCGFGDVSNFNHAFRREFGINPHSYRST